jgi:hypothetical protein
MTYSKIDATSLDTVSSALDLFKSPATKTSTLKGNTRHVNPIGDVDNAQLEFVFRTNNFNYWHPQHTRLLLQASVVKSDGQPIEDADTCTVVPVTNLLHSMWQVASLAIGNSDVSYEGNYPYVAYGETLVSRSIGYKKTTAGSAMWIEDDAGRVDLDDLGRSTEADIKARKALISTSRKFELCDHLHIPFLNQNRYALSDTTVKLTLTRSSDKLSLMKTSATDTNDYKIVIHRCTLLVHEIIINPSVINSHMTLLDAGNQVMYPLNQVETQMFTISAGKLSDRIVIRTNQQHPKRVAVAFIDHEAKNGSYSKDPFKFQHFDVRRLAIDVDGQPVPAKPIETDFGSGLVGHAYHNLAMATGKSLSNDDHGISLEAFKKGHTIFMFDLTPDACEGAGTHLINFGSLSLEVTFGTALPNIVSLFVLLERDELIKFDKNKTVEKLPRL